MQGYSSKERKGSLFEDWDLLDNGATETSQVCIFPIMLCSFATSLRRKPSRSIEMYVWEGSSEIGR